MRCKLIIMILISCLSLGCKSNVDANNIKSNTSIDKQQVSTPMTAIGPTRDLFMLAKTPYLASPDLMQKILQVREKDGFYFNIHLLESEWISPDKLVHLRSWVNSFGVNNLNLLLFSKLEDLPGNTYVQDSFHFYWDKQNNEVVLLSPSNDKLKSAYEEFANKIGIKTKYYQVEQNSNFNDLRESLKGYAAGGNWEVFPNDIAIALKPTQLENFLSQISSQSGYEYDYFFNEEKIFYEPEYEDMNEAEVNTAVHKIITSKSFLSPKKYEVEVASILEDELFKLGINTYKVDSYNVLKKKLTSVDHLDEHFMAIRHKNGGNCEIALIFPDPHEAYKIVDRNKRTRSKNDKEFCQQLRDNLYDDSSEKMEKYLTDLEYAKKNGCMPLLGNTDDDFIKEFNESDYIEDKKIIDYTKQQVLSILQSQGCYDSIVINVPSFLQVNIANSLVLTPQDGNSIVLRPDSFYEPIEQVISNRLKSFNIEDIPVNSLGLAIGNGNLHCATNIITDGF